MANPRVLDKRRKSIRNIRKITRTMELIATARFKKAMDRASAATAYTDRITQVVADLARAGLEVSHPLLDPRPEIRNARLLVLTANRGLCGGYNGNVIRMATARRRELLDQAPGLLLDVSGKRGISGFRFRDIAVTQSYRQFDDQPAYAEVEAIANGYMQAYIAGELDRLDVVYTRFHSISKQTAVVETLLPLGSLTGEAAGPDKSGKLKTGAGTQSIYEFVPSAASLLEEVVPTSFRVRLFKCFLDAAVSEQIARMVAMKSATENANDMIRSLSMTYNRARQAKITGEIMEVIGGVNALEG
jgi:F-type H+-transporting ATPase subunit gamma